MKDKIIKYSAYGLYTTLVITMLYLLPYGAVDRAQAFGKWLNGGMSPSEVRYMACIQQKDPKRVTLCNAVIKQYEDMR